MTLTEFLVARIAEDEADAKNARYNPAEHWWLPDYADPERVLAKCEAKRRIVGLLDDAIIGWDELDVGYSPEDWLAKQIARAWGLLYAGHPDYDESWRL